MEINHSMKLIMGPISLAHCEKIKLYTFIVTSFNKEKNLGYFLTRDKIFQKRKKILHFHKNNVF